MTTNVVFHPPWPGYFVSDYYMTEIYDRLGQLELILKKDGAK